MTISKPIFHLLIQQLLWIILIESNFYIEAKAWNCSNEQVLNLQPNGSYELKGTFIDGPSGIRIYQVGNNNGKILIGIGDIMGFGYSTNNFQLCDVLAGNNTGFKVVFPDFYHGNPWNIDRGPPIMNKNPEFRKFMEDFSWENSVRSDLRKVINFYKNKGENIFGIFGTKSGAAKTLEAISSNDFYKEFQVAGIFSPVPITIDSAKNVKVPLCFFPETYLGNHVEIQMVDFCKKLHENNEEIACTGKDYPGIKKIFVMGTEANWSKDLPRKIAEDQILTFRNFLCKYI